MPVRTINPESWPNARSRTLASPLPPACAVSRFGRGGEAGCALVDQRRRGATHRHRAAEKPVPWNEGHCDLLSTRHRSHSPSALLGRENAPYEVGKVDRLPFLASESSSPRW